MLLLALFDARFSFCSSFSGSAPSPLLSSVSSPLSSGEPWLSSASRSSPTMTSWLPSAKLTARANCFEGFAKQTPLVSFHLFNRPSFGKQGGLDRCFWGKTTAASVTGCCATISIGISSLNSLAYYLLKLKISVFQISHFFR